MIGKDVELQQLTLLAVCGTAFIYKNCKQKSGNKLDKAFDLSIFLNSTTFITLYIFPVSQIPSTDLSSLINVCVYQLRSHHLDVPEETTNLIFSLNKDLVQPLIDSLGLSESGVQVLAEVYIFFQT